MARKAKAQAPIRLLVLDVDGVLTDGRLYYGVRGQTLQAFHVRDGHGIKAVLAAGIKIAVISGRSARGVALRCRELGIREVHQGVADKLSCVKALCQKFNIQLADCAAIGDDSPDAPVLSAVALGFAVADAHEDAKAAASFLTELPGGQGAVREVCDLLVRSVRPWVMSALMVGLFALGGCNLSSPPPDPTDAAIVSATQGGYTATGAELSATDGAGQARYTLRAAQIVQAPGEQPVDLTDVIVEFPDSRGTVWVLTAKSGRMSSTRRDQPAIVDLKGDVVLKNDGRGAAGPLALETSALQFDTAANVAMTRQPVKLKSGTRIIEARGFTVNLATRRLTLEAEVHGRFVP